VVIDGAGNLYGTTFLGGADDRGTVFQVAAGSHALTTWATFNGANGGNPDAGVILDTSGNLYGTTFYDRPAGFGTLFQVAAAGAHTLPTWASFSDIPSGAGPNSSLIADADGNLYGTTAYGGAAGHGSVFRVDAAPAHTLTTLFSFDGDNGDY